MTTENFIIKIVNRTLQLAADEYADFSFKTGREKNPATGELEECIVLDMMKDGVVSTEHFFQNGETN